jgi:hypothetical protein
MDGDMDVDELTLVLGVREGCAVGVGDGNGDSDTPAMHSPSYVRPFHVIMPEKPCEHVQYGWCSALLGHVTSRHAV